MNKKNKSVLFQDLYECKYLHSYKQAWTVMNYAWIAKDRIEFSFLAHTHLKLT